MPSSPFYDSELFTPAGRNKESYDKILTTRISAIEPYADKLGFTLDELDEVLDHLNTIRPSDSECVFPAPSEFSVDDTDTAIGVLVACSKKFKGIDMLGAFFVLRQQWLLRVAVYINKDTFAGTVLADEAVTLLHAALRDADWKTMFRLAALVDTWEEPDTPRTVISAMSFVNSAVDVYGWDNIDVVKPYFDRGIRNFGVAHMAIEADIDAALLVSVGA